MIVLKLYKYDRTKASDGYRGTDLTEYVLQGGHNHEDITQEMDYSEITLLGYPSGVAFTPESKFIIDICEGDYKTSVVPPSTVPQITEDFRIIETLHRIVKEDAVQLPVLSDEKYYKHTITFIEPSVVAQKRLVDNIAVTYKLKDVNLDTKTTYILDTKSGFVNNTNVFTPQYDFGDDIGIISVSAYAGKKLQFENTPKVSVNGTITDLRYIKIQETTDVTITIPRLLVYGGISGTKNFTSGLPISIAYSLQKYDEFGNLIATVASGEIEESSDLSGIYGATKKSSSESKATWLIENYVNYNGVISPQYRKYTSDIDTTPSYIVTATLQPNYTYKLAVIPKVYSDTWNGKYDGAFIQQSVYYKQYAVTRSATIGAIAIDESIYTQTATFVTYKEEDIQQVLTSAVPYTALTLLKKAVVNSNTTEKTSGIAVGDINHQNQTSGVYDYKCPFYIDPAFTTELAKTQVIESFFQNKNLWEVLTEVGNYIHAIPEIKFGNDEKFMITFNRLGQTQETAEGGVRSSIINSQGVDDYICATNSYVDNLVQLGGEIDEWVVAKTTDSNCLVYNDTAEIITSKKIIELLQLEIKCNSGDYSSIGIASGAIADGTKYIYEENVYKILSVQYNQIPNKGIAMYYTLGENRLKGGDYRLPRSVTDIYNDYTFKKLIYTAFIGYPTTSSGVTSGYWTNIKVADFSFHIRYRTKDSVRISHTRPDIRKFLLNTAVDTVPQHWQINNQTDTLIDSQKFGSNMYGTLLRTGNNEYTETEWLTSTSKTRKKGEIRKIGGEIYYVATVDNCYYTNHIESTVTYSKDYNQLSKVIGIPSEPRFYEISEQSSIKRDVAINDYLFIGLTKTNATAKWSGFFRGLDFIKKLVFGIDTADLPKYAFTAFKGDGTNGIDSTNFGDTSLYKEVLSPINAYSSGNTLTFEWEMSDNFSAGDSVSDTTSPSGTADDVYSTLKAVQYTDKYGKSSLFDFYILTNYVPSTFDLIKKLPETELTATEIGDNYIGYKDIFATNVKTMNTSDIHERGLTLLKDCREQIAFNYNLIAITDSDTLITSPFLFATDKANPYLVCLSEEINKFNNGYISTSAIIYKTILDSACFVDTKADDPYDENGIIALTTVRVAKLLNSAVDEFFADDSEIRIKAIAICYDFDSNQSMNKFIIARNIPDPTNKTDTIRNWFLSFPSQALFSNIDGK